MIRSFYKVLSFGIGIVFAVGCGNLGTKAALSPAVSPQTEVGNVLSANPTQTEDEEVPSPVASPQTEEGNIVGEFPGGIASRERTGSDAPTPSAEGFFGPASPFLPIADSRRDEASRDLYASTPIPPMEPLSDGEGVWKMAVYTLRAVYGPTFSTLLDPGTPVRLSYPADGPVEIRLLPQWRYVDFHGAPFGDWYSTLDGTTLRYVWTPFENGSGGAEACDVVIKETGGPIGTEIFPIAPPESRIRLPLAAGRLKVFAYDPSWRMISEGFFVRFSAAPCKIPPVSSCKEGIGPLSSTDFSPSGESVGGQRCVFPLASFDLVPVVDLDHPPESFSAPLPR